MPAFAHRVPSGPLIRAKRRPLLGNAVISEYMMSKHGHLPPVPPANQSQKGTGDHSETPAAELRKKKSVNPAEQGETANIKQNTTNKGFFKGRRVK